ncbi:hypothetical protein FF1_027519 [Malus domestica]|uniref:uncharacterized protein LOC126611295 n=1 Tax=Malus sylvestris TaxID=3752 RepID=UPI0021AC899B|nr:uncharacterized protein LOC126611295 [Malus sylvestris]
MVEQGGEDGKLERASEHRCFSHGGHEVELAAAIGGGVDEGGAVAAASGSLETMTGSSRSDLTTSSKETKVASNTYQGWRKQGLEATKDLDRAALLKPDNAVEDLQILGRAGAIRVQGKAMRHVMSSTSGMVKLGARRMRRF